MTPRALRALALPLATVAVLGLAAPASAAPAGPLVQAETLQPLSGRTKVSFDLAASAREGLTFLTNATVRATLTTSLHADRLVLRVRGDQAGGAPRADVLVDGRPAGSVSVPSTTWADATLRGSWAPGTHVVEVRYVNDALVAGRDRNLRLDRITFGARTTTSSTTTASQFASRVRDLTNAERAEAGLRPLQPLDCAQRLAQDWSAGMARTGVFAHRPQADFQPACNVPGLRGWGENIAYTDAGTPERLVDMWMGSPGHRSNILSPGFTHLGVGTASSSADRLFGTQVFYEIG